MAEKSKEMYEFKKRIKFLKSQRGEGTELISVYIPPGANVNETTNRLRDEYGQALNIKSKQTRNNVQSAIERIIQMLKGVNKSPANGVAIFCGMLNGKIEIYDIIPPLPMQISVYRCDSSFFTAPLEEMIDVQDTYGIVVMDRREATIATMKGKTVNIVRKMSSGVPGKHGKGGQSQNRMQRLIEDAAEQFFSRVGQACDEIFLDTKIKGVIVGGSGPTKEGFAKNDYMNNNVKKKILGIIDTGYTDETGIKEVVEKSQQVVQGLEITRERDLVNKFLKEAVTSGLATYGISQVREALAISKVEILLLSEALDEKLIDELTELAEQTGTKVEMISIETPEGTQFFQGFKGIGALLRYK